MGVGALCMIGLRCPIVLPAHLLYVLPKFIYVFCCKLWEGNQGQRIAVV